MKNGKLLKTCLALLMFMCLSAVLKGNAGLVARAEEKSATYVINQAGAGINAPVSFDTLEDSWFVSGEKEFNSHIARLSALLSMLCYKEYTGTPSHIIADGKTMDMCGFMEYLGFKDVRDVDLPLESSEETIHRTEIYIGHKTVGETELVAVMVRGTNGTAEEWLSNFDLGFDNAKNENVEDMNNHEGFELTAKLVYDYIHDYKDELSIGNETYWVSGHSRGGAIANLLAARLCDDGKRNYTYTFAAPGDTMHKDVGEDRYQSIFNIINRDDLIPVVPLGSWGFMLYGRSAQLSLSKADKEAFQEGCMRDGKAFKYNGDEKKVKRFSDVFASFIGEGSTPIKSLNTLQCVHVTGVPGTGISVVFDTEEAKRIFEAIPEDARKRCHLVDKDDEPGKSYICIPPVALIQCFRALFDKNLTGTARLDNLQLLTSCEQLQDLVTLIVQLSLNDFLTAPHMPYGYYLLTESLEASDFRTEPVKKPYEEGKGSDPDEKESSTESSSDESSAESSTEESIKESSADKKASEEPADESSVESSAKESTRKSSSDEDDSEDKDSSLKLVIIIACCAGVIVSGTVVALVIRSCKRGKGGKE